MEYRNIGDVIYIRGDRGDELVSTILEVCKREHIASATFSGIGGCSSAEIQTFDPVTSTFSTTRLEGMLELVSYMGNVISDEAGGLHHHTHALFSFVKDGRHEALGGHLKATTVLYTAEIELRPVQGGAIGYRRDPETGTGFWAF